MAARDAMLLVIALLICCGLNTVRSDDCTRNKNTWCLDDVPPTCSGTSHHVNCAKDLRNKVGGCDEMTVKTVDGRIRALEHMAEVVCAERSLKTVFDGNHQCWKSISECVLPFVTTPFTYVHEEPTAVDCENANIGLASCLGLFSESCPPEIANLFVDRMRAEMPSPCRSGINSAFHFATLAFLALLIFLLSN